jgi:hypothetical protein
MKNRFAGLVVVLFSFLAFGVANADFDGVIDPKTTVTWIDSVEFAQPDTTFLTWGWGSHTPYDTFRFTGVPSGLPASITLHGTVNSFPVHNTINHPQPDSWYRISFLVVTSMVGFGVHPSVVEAKPEDAPPTSLAVSPSVVTEQMTVRLQTVGTGRQLVEIHDAMGNVVRSLDCTAGADGAATATWNREDEFGRLVPVGVYFCRYAGTDVIAVRKVLVAH